MDYKYLTEVEAAEILRRTPAALRSLRHKGKGPRSHKRDGRVLYRSDDIVSYAENREEKGNSRSPVSM